MYHNVHTVSGFIKGWLGDYWIDDEYSRNGLQVDAGRDVDAEVTRVAFAVDACLETIEKAAEAGAQMLVVHHGISWGSGIARIDGITAERVSALFRHGVSLFACHLPLDAHPEFGNNAVIAKRLGLKVTDWFYESHGLKLAALCELESPMRFDELAARAKEAISQRTAAYDNSGGTVNTIAILSGSGDSAIDEGSKVPFDCLVTGEFQHKYFHEAAEMEVSVLSCGHYDTEVTGIQELMKIVERCCKLEAVFIDAPTGL